MTTVDRFTGGNKLSISVLEFIMEEFKKARGSKSSSISKDLLKKKFKSMNDEEITQRMDAIIAAVK